LSIIRELIQLVVGELTVGFKSVLEGYADRTLRRVLRTLVLAGVGITFAAVGSTFILIGIVTYLSQFMYGGLAWGLVGLIAVLVGGVLLLLIRR